MTGADIQILLKKHPTVVVCLVIALACGAALYLRSGKNEEDRATLDQKNKEAEKMLANVRNSAGLPQQTQAMQDTAKQAEARLIRPAQLATNQQFFFRLENETGVKMLDVRQNSVPSKAPGGKTYVPVPFTTSVQGSFKQVLDFLERASKGPHFVRFTSVNFVKSGNAAGAADIMTVTCSLDLLGAP